MNDNYLHVRIISPKELIFEGSALSVSSTNSAGKFDILPSHANFISLIKNQPIIVQNIKKEVKTYNFSFAIISLTGNKVNIYTDLQISTPNK